MFTVMLPMDKVRAPNRAGAGVLRGHAASATDQRELEAARSRLSLREFGIAAGSGFGSWSYRCPCHS